DGTKIFKNRWRYNIDKMKEVMGGKKDEDFSDIYKKNAVKVNVKNKDWYVVGKIVFKGSKNVPNHKKYLEDVSDITVHTIWDDIESQKLANENLIEIFDGKKVFDNPKPIGLIKKAMAISTDNDSLILDFFAGSGTTGQAVWDLNKEDGGNRKFILVQLDEEVLDEEIKKEFPTVADICIERLRRVSEKYRQENNNQDFGFKVFRLDKSNFNLKDEFEIQEGKGVEELKQKYLKWLGAWINEPLVPGWKAIDVVYEVMLKEGFNLNSKIEEVEIKNNNFYYVKDAGENLDFYISLDDKIKNKTIEEIRTTKYKNKMFVFLDRALTDDDKINLTTFVRLKVI
ncbi:DNA methyltransferase, partial [Caldisericum sp.]|uniref:DNA methyltransferase n=1 Tax=Caldisericum sp. TaxID=2499687 RepID=UPI003D0AE2C8